MSPDEYLQKAITNIGRNGPRAKAWGEMCAEVRAGCDSLPKDAKMTTRSFLRHLGWTHVKGASQALWQMRRHGGVPEGFWERDNTRRFMGNDLILWRKPLHQPKPDIDVSIF
jgi:hypothetical protein